MNMDNFDKDIWMLHRKLFHRYIKYFKYFKAATEALPEYQRLLEEEAEEDDEEEEEDKAAAARLLHPCPLLPSFHYCPHPPMRSVRTKTTTAPNQIRHGLRKINVS